jgi:3-hydroxyisobutyrate dehydrogenase-like beta-hydroxyacid dehydrogenase
MATVSDELRDIGLIGIGLLGSALAERLLRAGFTVRGYDTSAAALDSFAAMGGHSLDNVKSLPFDGRTIVLCLPNSTIVEQVLATIQPHLQPNTVIIDTTTGDPRRTQVLEKSLQNINVELVDATVLGSSDVTRRGDAVLMVGASSTAFDRCQPILQAISNTVRQLGSTGRGQEMKLVANLVLGLNRAALAEGLHFAKSLDLDLSQVLEILMSGAASSRVMNAKGLKMIRGEFTPEARLSQHLKDVRLILSHAETAETHLPISELHRELLQRVQEDGGGDLDNSAIIQAW